MATISTLLDIGLMAWLQYPLCLTLFEGMATISTLLDIGLFEGMATISTLVGIGLMVWL